MMKRVFTVVICLLHTIILVAQQRAETQDSVKKSRREQNFYFLQQTLNYSRLSYACPPGFDRGSPKDWYILSADIVPQFVIGGDWMAFPIHVTPRYQVRIFRNNEVAGDSSLPVRTPSYMPGATIHFRTKRMHDSVLNVNYFSFSFFHFSNGQDGPEFIDDEINTYNGNFSTNYIEPAYHFRRRNKLANVFKNGKFYEPEDYFDFYGRLGVEWHFSTTKELEGSYGNPRINLTLGLVEVLRRSDKFENVKYYRERNRLVLNTTFIAGSRDHGLDDFSKRINFDLNYYWRIPSSPNTALFLATGYYGSDPYNIYYMDSYWFARAGLAFGFFVTPINRGEKHVNAAEVADTIRKK